MFYVEEGSCKLSVKYSGCMMAGFIKLTGGAH